MSLIHFYNPCLNESIYIENSVTGETYLKIDAGVCLVKLALRRIILLWTVLVVSPFKSYLVLSHLFII